MTISPAMPVLYHVTFCANPTKNMLHIFQQERFVAVTHPVEKPETVTAYHLINGCHMCPDMAAIRAAIRHQHRKAFDRAQWFYPRALNSEPGHVLDYGNACSATLLDRRGRVLGTLRAVPYLAA